MSATVVMVKQQWTLIVLLALIAAGCGSPEPSSAPSWCDASWSLATLADENGSAERLSDTTAEQMARSIAERTAVRTLVDALPDEIAGNARLASDVAAIADAYERQFVIFETYGFDRLRVLTEADAGEQNSLLATSSDRLVQAAARLNHAATSHCAL